MATNKELKALGCKDLLDLALLMPKRFEDLRLNDEPVLNIINCAKVSITASRRLSGNRLSCVAYAHNWECECAITIFNASAYHERLFAVGKELIISSKLGDFKGLLQFINPKILKNSGELSPIYKIKGISDDEICALKQRLITRESLAPYRLPDECVQMLLIMSENSNAARDLLDSARLAECLKFCEIFNHLQALQRSYAQSVLYKAIEPYNIKDWLAALPFRPTADQLQAMRDIYLDLSKKEHKIRIVMGDVGCGKSLVMFAAALMCYPNKAVLMAPTTVLAQQLFSEAKRLLPSDFRVRLYDSSAPEQSQAANLVIGTHALLWADLSDAILVMIDEQQRFSTKQRETLQKLAQQNEQNPHYIEFSATPIPRTTALIHSSVYSYSFIKELPFKKDIETVLISENEHAELFAHIKRENAQKHQAIIVYPLIEEGKNSLYKPLENVIAYYKKHFGKVYSTHGKDKQKDQIIAEFAEHGDILLSTTIVEVGISLPRLSIIVIVAPERYGLATLHQLRGRVGRNGVKSYCYLLSKKDFSERLRLFCTTLDGFKIAEIDLQNRKSGDLIDGSSQHGEMFKHFDPASDEAILQKARNYLASLS